MLPKFCLHYHCLRVVYNVKMSTLRDVDMFNEFDVYILIMFLMFQVFHI